MTHLTSSDLRKLQDCIREIYSNLNVKTFPDHIIRATSKVISSCVASYARIFQQNQTLVYRGIASRRTWDDLGAFVRHMDEHPILNYLHPELLKPHRFKDDIEKAMCKRFPLLRQFPHHSAAKISDGLAGSRFKSTAVFADFFRRNGIDHQLLISFLPTSENYSMLSFNRDKRDFSEKERLLLNLLAPHVAQAYKNAEAYEKAVVAFASLENSNQLAKPHVLTYKEEDVLYWVAQGKTNAETAKILNLAPGTVKIHLERIYQKLGVENRTAAAAFARGVSGIRSRRLG